MAIASVVGCVIYVDSDSGIVFFTFVRSKLVFNSFKIRVKELTAMNFESNVASYKIEDLNIMFIDLVRLGTAAIRFQEPRLLLMIQSDDLIAMNNFVQLFYNTCIQWNYLPSAAQRFTTCFNQYELILRINTRNLIVNNLNTLLLENIILPFVPANIDRVKISYLSLTGSTFGSMIQQNSFWDWITTCCSTSLIHLKMDSMKLKTVPFDIISMKHIETLSLANNYLTYLPHFIGELDNLKSLFLNNNRLFYLPGFLVRYFFGNFEISDSMFYRKTLRQGEEKPGLKTLSVLSFLSLLNKRIHFSRRDIPNGLWNYFYEFGRCRKCYSVVMSNKVNHIYESYLINMDFFDQDSLWQYFECNFDCTDD